MPISFSSAFTHPLRIYHTKCIRARQVGPIAEEVVFRGCFVPVLLGAGVSRVKNIWLSPLLFGFGKLLAFVARFKD